MMNKKVTLLFLCLTLLYHLYILSPIPTVAYTATPNSHTSFYLKEIKSYNDLVEACAVGGTYQLTNSIVLKNCITIPSHVNLTLLQEPGKKHSISADSAFDSLFYIKSDATLTLGVSSSDPVILNGEHLTDYGTIILSFGNLYINNANITSPNGRGIVCNTIHFEKGHIYNCKYEGLSLYTNGTLWDVSFSNCKYGVFIHPESTVSIYGGNYTKNQTAVYANGNCSIYDGCFSNCQYTLQSSSDGLIHFMGGTISDAGCWALDVSNGGSISFTGGEIRNSRSTTYPAPDKNVQGHLYIGGSPYMDETSFIYCRTGSPIIQTTALSTPSNHPNATLQIAAYSQDLPIVIANSDAICMENEKDWYVPYDSSYYFSVRDNKLYALGVVSPYDGQLPTLRPINSCQPTNESFITTPHAITVSPSTSTSAPTDTHAMQTQIPSETAYSPAPTEKLYCNTLITTESPALETTSTPTPSALSTAPPDSLPQMDYSNFIRTAPTITKIASKGLHFYINWDFDCILSPDYYNIYYSTDRKHFTLKKTVKGSLTTTSLSIPKASKGKRIYFRMVAIISGEHITYGSQDSNLVSGYLIPKVTVTSVSYHTNAKQLKVTWKQIDNCTGYYVYMKASSNGITSQKRCATVSHSKQKVTISSAKIKRLFSQNGKPVRVKKCYVRAYYKSGNKIAYSP